MRRLPMMVATLLLTAGCYHATIETGLPPSAQTISKPWAHGFIYGLVPPSTVETASKCKNGVAKVETQMSFLNGLVALITWEIYTPLQIDVTCASSSKMSDGSNGTEEAVIRAHDDSQEAASAALNEAAETALRTGKPALVVFAN